MGTTDISHSDPAPWPEPTAGEGLVSRAAVPLRPFAALTETAAALRAAHTRTPWPVDAGGTDSAAALPEVSENPAVVGHAPRLGSLLADAACVLDDEQRHSREPVFGGTTTTALTLARAHGGSIAVSDAPIELGLALRRRLARAGATAGADFDGDRLRVQPTGAADDDKEPIS